MNSPARCVSVGFLLTAATLGIPEAWGANLTWQASSGDWSIASNWGGTLPTGIDAAYLMNGGTATVTQLGETCVTLSLGGNSAGSGTVLMTAGTGSLAMTGYEYIGDSGIGNFTQSGGTNSVTSYLYVGNATGSRGT